MSTSNWQNISYNIELVKRLDPKSILDVGIGFGRWGILFREFLEVWGDNNFKGEWKRKIDGVEIFPPYIRPYHKFFYDNIYTGDAFDLIKKTKKKYDLINCGDVIEHFEKDKALEFINICLNKCDYLLINIPVGDNWEQGPVNGNVHEMHRSSWKKSDFTKFGNCLIREFRDIELRDFIVALISNRRIDLKKAYGKYFTVKNILKNRLGMKNIVSKIERK